MKIGFYALSIVYNLVFQIFYGLSFPCYVVFSQYPWVFIYYQFGFVPGWVYGKCKVVEKWSLAWKVSLLRNCKRPLATRFIWKWNNHRNLHHRQGPKVLLFITKFCVCLVFSVLPPNVQWSVRKLLLLLTVEMNGILFN